MQQKIGEFEAMVLEAHLLEALRHRRLDVEDACITLERTPRGAIAFQLQAKVVATGLYHPEGRTPRAQVSRLRVRRG